MTSAALARDVLIGLGVGLELACCAGLWLMRDPLDRLHFAAAGSLAPPALIAAAVWVAEGPTQPSIDATIVAGILVFLNAVVAHATAQAGLAARGGGPDAAPDAAQDAA